MLPANRIYPPAIALQNFNSERWLRDKRALNASLRDIRCRRCQCGSLEVHTRRRLMQGEGVKPEMADSLPAYNIQATVTARSTITLKVLISGISV